MPKKMKRKLNWPVIMLAVLIAFSLTATDFLINKTVAEDDGPKESTKKFFGDKGGGPGKFEPDECKREQEQQSGQGSDEQSKRQEGDDLSLQIREKEEALRNATSDEQRASLQSELDALTAQTNQLRNQSGGQGESQGDRSQRQEGPSAECKAAIVKMGKEKMATFASTITNNILPKLAKVEEIVAKVEAKIPELKDSEVSADIISKLESNITTIKSSAQTMKSFMTSMVQILNEFLSLADSDTDSAFAKMQNMHKSGKSDSASAAADALVSAFTELEEIIEELKEEGGSDGNQ